MAAVKAVPWESETAPSFRAISEPYCPTVKYIVCGSGVPFSLMAV